MERRPTFEDLQRRVTALERLTTELMEALVIAEDRVKEESSAREQTARSLWESDTVLRSVLDNSFDLIYRLNLKTDRFDYVSPSSQSFLGFSPDETSGLGFDRILSFIHPDDRDRLRDGFDKVAVSEDKSSSVEFRLKHRDKGYRWVSDTRSVVFDSLGEAIAIVGTLRDVTREKVAEEELRGMHERLESMVAERTARLEDANTALRVLLEKREDDLRAIEEKLLLNVRGLVMPFVDRLRKTGLSNVQRTHLEGIESNLEGIVAPFVRALSSQYMKLTGTEIEVANLVRQGKATKEIAELMNMSPRTIDTHRYNIRKKLGLKAKNANLRSYLLSFE